MNDRVQEMIESSAKDYSGKENIIFIIDEIGQYVGSVRTRSWTCRGWRRT